MSLPSWPPRGVVACWCDCRKGAKQWPQIARWFCSQWLQCIWGQHIHVRSSNETESEFVTSNVVRLKAHIETWLLLPFCKHMGSKISQEGYLSHSFQHGERSPGRTTCSSTSRRWAHQPNPLGTSVPCSGHSHPEPSLRWYSPADSCEDVRRLPSQYQTAHSMQLLEPWHTLPTHLASWVSWDDRPTWVWIPRLITCRQHQRSLGIEWNRPTSYFQLCQTTCPILGPSRTSGIPLVGRTQHCDILRLV